MLPSTRETPGRPLLNSSAKLIGMNTMIYSTSGSSAGLGFAVPVDTIKRIVPQIIRYGKVIRPGIGIFPLSDMQERRFGLPTEGVVVREVVENGPAAKVGIKGFRTDRKRNIYFDVITKIDNKKVSNLDEIYHLLDKYKVGDKVVVEFTQAGKKKRGQLTLESF